MEQRSQQQKSKQHYKNGLSLDSKKKYGEAIVEFKNCLVLRHASFGRYHKSTTKTLFWIGLSYHKKGDYDNAMIALHDWYRNNRYLNNDGGHAEDISSKALEKLIPKGSLLRTVLCKQGVVTKEQLREYDSNVLESIYFEKDGNAYREVQEYKSAIDKYMAAIAVSEKTITSTTASNRIIYSGRHAIMSVKVLWRKIAGITGCCSTNNSNVVNRKRKDWAQIDQIKITSTIGKKQQKQGRSINDGNESVIAKTIFDDKVIKLIQQGDIYHNECNHEEALEHYKKACNKERIVKIQQSHEARHGTTTATTATSSSTEEDSDRIMMDAVQLLFAGSRDGTIDRLSSGAFNNNESEEEDARKSTMTRQEHDRIDRLQEIIETNLDGLHFKMVEIEKTMIERLDALGRELATITTTREERCDSNLLLSPPSTEQMFNASINDNVMVYDDVVETNTGTSEHFIDSFAIKQETNTSNAKITSSSDDDDNETVWKSNSVASNRRQGLMLPLRQNLKIDEGWDHI